MVAVSSFGARVFRNNTGVLQNKHGQYVHYGLCNGSSDLIGWTKEGRFVAIEVKTPQGRVTEEQQDFIFAVRKAGGIAGVAHSPEEAISLLK